MIRTRFAPSPTGYMHIGNLRTALYTYLIAKHGGGTFILRIEDTDQNRNIPEAVQAIYKALSLAHLVYDEGPDKDGGYGPYVQSQRLPIYKEWAEKLIAQGDAYYCFCQKDDKPVSEDDDHSVNVTSDPCRNLTPQEVAEKLAANPSPAIRQRIPEGGSTTFQDIVYGDITIDHAQLDDQVLLKSDGFPTYNFANVIDDHLMGISHVARGREYLPSTPKYNLLYQAFGWEIPAYIHLPLIVKEDGSKLSKRKGDPSFEDLVQMGYLPEAIINYVSLLGWNPGTDQEFFLLDDLVKVFDYNRINKANAAFSFDKLKWLNGEHIRALTPEAFHAAALPWYPESVRHLDLPKLSQLIQIRTEVLGDIPELVSFLGELPSYEVGLFESEKSKSTLPSSMEVLKAVIPQLEALETWSNADLFSLLKAFAQSSEQKVGTVMWPIRTALSGLPNTPGGATELADILGKRETIHRLKRGLAKLLVSGMNIEFA